MLRTRRNGIERERGLLRDKRSQMGTDCGMSSLDHWREGKN